jgi:4-hydroxy-tetrahydrodipicolinate reductase
VVHYGLGPIGLAVAALVAQRPWLRSVAAVDLSPDLVGRRLGDLSGSAVPGPVISPSYASTAEAAVAVHCTGSSLERVAPQIIELASAGLNVISTTEELAFPWQAHPRAAAEIDTVARGARVTVLGTGINPGYAMDYLPIALSAVAQRVDKVVVHRVQDAATRRLPLQRKVGAGLSPEAFRANAADGRLGHVGLAESAHALARALGWRLTDLHETIEPITAEAATSVAEGVIEPGQVLGLHQTAQGRVDSKTVIDLTLDIGIAVGPSRDKVLLMGVPDLELEVPRGLHGDTATAAIVVNGIPRVLAAPPGLAVMAELPPPTPGPPE